MSMDNVTLSIIFILCLFKDLPVINRLILFSRGGLFLTILSRCFLDKKKQKNNRL